MMLLRMYFKQGIHLAVWIMAIFIPALTFSQIDLAKIDEYKASRDCEKGTKFIEKNAANVQPADPQFVEFNYKALDFYISCKDWLKVGETAKILYDLNKVTNKRAAAELAFYAGTGFYYIGEVDTAIHYSKIAADLCELEYGNTHSDYFRAIILLGVCYTSNGEYTSAKRVFRDARKIKERLEAYDKQYARILNGLGDLYTRTYNYQDAENCLERSLDLKKKISEKAGEENIRLQVDYANALYKTVNLKEKLGGRQNYLLALESIKETMSIYQKAQNEENYAKCRIREGQIYLSLDSIGQAITILNEVIAKYFSEEKTSNENRANLSRIYNSLSHAWMEEGDPEKAIDFSNKSLQEMGVAKGDDHPDYAIFLRHHANILFKINRSDTLDNLYIRSSEIIGKTYRKRNFEYYKSQLAYFSYLVRSGQQSKALELYDDLGRSLEKYIIELNQYLTIAELSNVTDTYQEYFHALLTLNLLQSENAELRIRSANAALFFKGYILEKIIEDRQAIKRSSELTELQQKISDKRIRLDELYKADEPDQGLIDEVKQEYEELERNFSRIRGNQIKPYESIEAEDVVYSLLSNEAAIEFIRIKIDKDDDPHYAALLFHPDEDEPFIIDLFKESKITDLFKEGSVDTDALYAKLYQSGPTRGLAPSEEKSNVSLYHMIWEKLIPHLDNIDRIYYSADGVIHAIALHAVELPSFEYTGQVYALVQTTSLRNMAKDDLPKMYNENRTAFVVGGIDFGVQDVAMVRGRGQVWEDLRATQIEVTEIESKLREKEFEVSAMQGPEPTHDAVLEALKKTPSPRLIHLASHGYFESDNFLDVGDELDASASQLDLSRSGIVLAGANDLPDGQYILTSNEIAELDLENTEVVVLSACETGLGQLYAQQGVSGLQRAFKIAGTKYMIMSLWRVPDRPTMIFMDHFYKYYITEGKTVEESYYLAQREFMSTGSEPKGWAGFVLIR